MRNYQSNCLNMFMIIALLAVCGCADELGKQTKLREEKLFMTGVACGAVSAYANKDATSYCKNIYSEFYGDAK